MLHSLQGLQQRLEDFSVTDVTNAEANARTLILCLKQFQDTIAAIALLKNAASNIRQSIAEVPQVDIDVVGMASLENHPQLHAIVKASKLIKMQKLMAALRTGVNVGASQEQPSLDPATAAFALIERSANFSGDTSQAAESEPVDYIPTHRPERTIEEATSRHESKPAPLNTVAIDSSSVLETTEDSGVTATAANDTGSLNIATLADFPTAEAEFENAIAAVTEGSPIATGSLVDFAAPAEQLPDSRITVESPVVKLATNLPKAVKPKQDSQIAPLDKSKDRNKKPNRVDPSKALVPTNESFDLRLLDDLVTNYGEFASNPNLPAMVKKNELQSVEPGVSAHHENQPEHASPAHSTAPMVRKHGDLDRQLKKIIKDYGEYDIYSDKQNNNLKKAGIVAFVVLGLVFGGIYFFKAPPSTAKPAPAASDSSSVTPDDPKPQTGAAGTNGDHHDSALGSTQNKIKPTPTKH